MEGGEVGYVVPSTWRRERSITTCLERALGLRGTKESGPPRTPRLRQYAGKGVVHFDPNIRRLHAQHRIIPVTGTPRLHSPQEENLAVGDASVTPMPRIMGDVLETSRIGSTRCLDPPCVSCPCDESPPPRSPRISGTRAGNRGATGHGVRSTDSGYPRTLVSFLVPLSDIDWDVRVRRGVVESAPFPTPRRASSRWVSSRMISRPHGRGYLGRGGKGMSPPPLLARGPLPEHYGASDLAMRGRGARTSGLRAPARATLRDVQLPCVGGDRWRGGCSCEWPLRGICRNELAGLGFGRRPGNCGVAPQALGKANECLCRWWSCCDRKPVRRPGFPGVLSGLT